MACSCLLLDPEHPAKSTHADILSVLYMTTRCVRLVWGIAASKTESRVMYEESEKKKRNYAHIQHPSCVCVYCVVCIYNLWIVITWNLLFFCCFVRSRFVHIEALRTRALLLHSSCLFPAYKVVCLSTAGEGGAYKRREHIVRVTMIGMNFVLATYV